MNTNKKEGLDIEPVLIVDIFNQFTPDILFNDFGSVFGPYGLNDFMRSVKTIYDIENPIEFIGKQRFKESLESIECFYKEKNINIESKFFIFCEGILNKHKGVMSRFNEYFAGIYIIPQQNENLISRLQRIMIDSYFMDNDNGEKFSNEDMDKIEDLFSHYSTYIRTKQIFGDIQQFTKKKVNTVVKI